MIEIIHYDEIEKKNIIEGNLIQTMTPNESLIHCLDLLDFMAAFRREREEEQNDEIDWIILEVKRYD